MQRLLLCTILMSRLNKPSKSQIKTSGKKVVFLKDISEENSESVSQEAKNFKNSSNTARDKRAQTSLCNTRHSSERFKHNMISSESPTTEIESEFLRKSDIQNRMNSAVKFNIDKNKQMIMMMKQRAITSMSKRKKHNIDTKIMAPLNMTSTSFSTQISPNSLSLKEYKAQRKISGKINK